MKAPRQARRHPHSRAPINFGPTTPGGLLHSDKWTCTLQAVGHLVTIIGCSEHWNLRLAAAPERVILVSGRKP